MHTINVTVCVDMRHHTTAEQLPGQHRRKTHTNCTLIWCTFVLQHASTHRCNAILTQTLYDVFSFVHCILIPASQWNSHRNSSEVQWRFFQQIQQPLNDVNPIDGIIWNCLKTRRSLFAKKSSYFPIWGDCIGSIFSWFPTISIRFPEFSILL